MSYFASPILQFENNLKNSKKVKKGFAMKIELCSKSVCVNNAQKMSKTRSYRVQLPLNLHPLILIKVDNDLSY